MHRKAKRLYLRRKKEINYLVAGGWNTFFGYICFALLYYFLSAHLTSFVIVIINNVITVTNNYVWYKLFVFKTKGNYFREYLRFYAVYGVALAFNLGALPLMVDYFMLNAYVSQAAITVVIIIMSYVANNKFAFKNK